MRDRSTPVARAGRTPAAATLDLVCLTALGRQLAVLVRVPTRAGAAALPWIPLESGAPLEITAGQWAREMLGRTPSWIAQLGAFGDGRKHPSGAPLSVCHVAVVSAATEPPVGLAWRVATDDLGLTARQRQMLTSAISTLRDRMDIAPVAFRMLPVEFTLSDLQGIYELLLGRRLHKASFRRALQGSYLVEPVDAWRSDGRGRPAQLFRYAPRKRRGVRRSVRFELLG